MNMPDPQARLAPRILLVEPNRSAMGVLARRLSETGYRVAAAANAKVPMDWRRMGQPPAAQAKVSEPK